MTKSNVRGIILASMALNLSACGPDPCPEGKHTDCSPVLAPGFIACACVPNGEKLEDRLLDGGGAEITIVPDDDDGGTD